MTDQQTQHPYLACIDTETALIARGRLAPPLTCLSHYVEGNEPGLEHVRKRRLRDTLVELIDNGYWIIGANIAYDIAVLVAEYWHDRTFVETVFTAARFEKFIDVQLAAKFVDIAEAGDTRGQKYSLGALSERYGFGEMDKSTWRLKYGELRDTPIAEWEAGAVKYALDDATRPVEVFRCLEEKALGKYPKMFASLGAATRTAVALHLISCWGMRTDPAQVRRFKNKTQRRLDDARDLLLEHGMLSPKRKRDPDGELKRNTKVAKAWMVERCKELGIKPTLTDKGAVQLNEDAIRRVNDPVLNAYQTYTSANGLMTRIETLEEGTRGPLQSQYDPVKATGRTGCSKPREPLVGDQAQNMPKLDGYRECYAPSQPGWVYIGADFGGMELATIAQVCLWAVGASKLAENIRKGVDAHSVVAAVELGCPYEEVRDGYRAGVAKYVEARQRGKIGMFGTFGMAGARVLREQARVKYNVNLSLVEAKRIKRAVSRACPEQDKYFRWVEKTLKRNNGIMRAFVTGMYRKIHWPSEGANFPFQALGATAATKALWYVTEACYSVDESPLYGFRPVAFVHDELLVEGPASRAHEAALELSRLMELGFSEVVPDVPSKAEPVVMSHYSKNARPVFKQDGTLGVWTPDWV